MEESGGLVWGHVEIPFRLENGETGTLVLRAIVLAGDRAAARLSTCGTVAAIAQFAAHGLHPTVNGKEIR